MCKRLPVARAIPGPFRLPGGVANPTANTKSYKKRTAPKRRPAPVASGKLSYLTTPAGV